MMEQDLLPVDEGRIAFQNRVSENPYPETSWKHNEWQFGWDAEEQVNPDLYDHAAGKFTNQNSQFSPSEKRN
ncbi:hypothetical protein H5185_04805 [Shewanella sp. SG44-6]|uniref:hypothetical protein n=1 Tax=Shewanella sp. SG44-6 TaxID=2760959 RepID=UPI001600426C|nr:hypothetical protein [Shewanella sp. SG44-6]MBB1388743.1 hypothetical protein [Shewanella sp. SG44-6]